MSQIDFVCFFVISHYVHSISKVYPRYQAFSLLEKGGMVETQRTSYRYRGLGQPGCSERTKPISKPLIQNFFFYIFLSVRLFYDNPHITINTTMSTSICSMVMWSIVLLILLYLSIQRSLYPILLSYRILFERVLV